MCDFRKEMKRRVSFRRWWDKEQTKWACCDWPVETIGPFSISQPSTRNKKALLFLVTVTYGSKHEAQSDWRSRTEYSAVEKEGGFLSLRLYFLRHGPVCDTAH